MAISDFVRIRQVLTICNYL